MSTPRVLIVRNRASRRRVQPCIFASRRLGFQVRQLAAAAVLARPAAGALAACCRGVVERPAWRHRAAGLRRRPGQCMSFRASEDHALRVPERGAAVKEGRRPPPQAARSVLDGRDEGGGPPYAARRGGTRPAWPVRSSPRSRACRRRKFSPRVTHSRWSRQSFSPHACRSSSTSGSALAPERRAASIERPWSALPTWCRLQRPSACGTGHASLRGDVASRSDRFRRDWPRTPGGRGRGGVGGAGGVAQPALAAGPLNPRCPPVLWRVQ